MDNIIEVKNVTFEYTDGESTQEVIKDFSVNIERGSFTVILGHNGSGKSTLAKLFNGLYKPASGKIYVDGIDTADESREIEVKRRVGMVFQNPDNQLVASIVEEDVAFGPENLGIDPKEIRRRGPSEKRFLFTKRSQALYIRSEHCRFHYFYIIGIASVDS